MISDYVEKAYLLLQCYSELLEKFPGSASLRLDYANFCDVVGFQEKCDLAASFRILYSIERRRACIYHQKVSGDNFGCCRF